jgi:hypothetical protein
MFTKINKKIILKQQNANQQGSFPTFFLLKLS